MLSKYLDHYIIGDTEQTIVFFHDEQVEDGCNVAT